MTGIAIVISFIVFSVLFYGSLPRDLSIFRRFDFLFRTILIFVLIGRLYGLFGEGVSVGMEWGLSPIQVDLDGIEFFAKFPWIILRVWDLNWGYPGFLFSAILATFVSYILGFRDYKLGVRIISDLIVSIFVVYTIILFTQFLLSVNVFEGEINIFNLGYSISQGFFNLLIILFCTILVVTMGVRNISGHILFLYGFLNVLLMIVDQYLNLPVLEMTLKPLQSGAFIVIGVCIFIYWFFSKNLANINIDDLDRQINTESKYSRGNFTLSNLYRGRYVPPTTK